MSIMVVQSIFDDGLGIMEIGSQACFGLGIMC
jgi:hypothetical protein